MAKPKRPKDTNQLAKMIADISTGEVYEIKPIKTVKKIRRKKKIK